MNATSKNLINEQKEVIVESFFGLLLEVLSIFKVLEFIVA
jgi:hypothetical protein